MATFSNDDYESDQFSDDPDEAQQPHHQPSMRKPMPEDKKSLEQKRKERDAEGTQTKISDDDGETFNEQGANVSVDGKLQADDNLYADAGPSLFGGDDDDDDELDDLDDPRESRHEAGTQDEMDEDPSQVPEHLRDTD